MAENQSATPVTSGLVDPPAETPSAPVVTTSQITTTDLTSTVNGSGPGPDPLYPPGGPDPKGTLPGAVEQMKEETPTDPSQGTGIEGEQVVWEGRYSLRNFVGRLAWRALATVGWLVLAVYTWGFGRGDLTPVTVGAGVVLALFWLALGWRILQARHSHFYRLTTRRLFVSTGLLRRREDQMELLGVKDVFLRQALLDRWLSIGTVVVVSTDSQMPVYYLAGVEDPKRVLDLVWHCARSERDHRSVKVDEI